jgi:hypothetical protein
MMHLDEKRIANHQGHKEHKEEQKNEPQKNTDRLTCSLYGVSLLDAPAFFFLRGQPGGSPLPLEGKERMEVHAPLIPSRQCNQ